MNNLILFLHILSAIVLGSFLSLPFLAGRISTATGQTRSEYIDFFSRINRVGQYGLIAEFITGGYMISNHKVSPVWIVLVFILLIGLGAVTGILGARIKKLSAFSESGGDTTALAAAVKSLSWAILPLLVVIVFLMVYRSLFR